MAVKTLSISKLQQSPVQTQVTKRKPTGGRDAAHDNPLYLPIVLFPRGTFGLRQPAQSGCH